MKTNYSNGTFEFELITFELIFLSIIILFIRFYLYLNFSFTLPNNCESTCFVEKKDSIIFIKYLRDHFDLSNE